MSVESSDIYDLISLGTDDLQGEIDLLKEVLNQAMQRMDEDQIRDLGHYVVDAIKASEDAFEKGECGDFDNTDNEEFQQCKEVFLSDL